MNTGGQVSVSWKCLTWLQWMVALKIQRSAFRLTRLWPNGQVYLSTIALNAIVNIQMFFTWRCSNWLLSHALYKSNITKCFKAKNSCTRWISKLSLPSKFSHMAWIHGAGITQRQLQMNGQLWQSPYPSHMKASCRLWL